MAFRGRLPNTKHGSGFPGRHTLSEILSQPRCWAECLATLCDGSAVSEITESFSDKTDWIFVGCGSSYYLALSAAANWTSITGRKAWAVPTSEILFYPNLVNTCATDLAAVLISRSGQTSEAVLAAEWFRARRIPTIAVSCCPKQPLEKAATAAIVLPKAAEQSTVMTRSFSSMLLALQFLAAKIVGDTNLTEAIHQFPSEAERHFSGLAETIKSFVEGTRFADYVCLGEGPFYGLACESALKLTEMSCSYGQSFHTLEFGHGPKLITAAETLIVFLISEAGYQAELDVLKEIKRLGATTVAISPKHEPRARAAADVFVEMPSNLPELVRAPAYAFVPQLLGLYTGLKKGFNPDEPRNLTRAVMLTDKVNPRHATLRSQYLVS